MVVFCGAVFVVSYVTNLYIFSIIYGFITGMAGGIGYMTSIIVVVEYFPAKKGLVIGILLSGFGLGSFTFSFIAQKLMNPDNADITGKSDFNPDVA